MKNGKFTKKERKYLLSLDAVENVTEIQIRYSDKFKQEFLERYKKGDKPLQIFTDAGFTKELIGYKRIERASARWRAAEKKKNSK